MDLPEECDEVAVHGDAVDHPVGERDPAYVDVVAATNGVLDGDVLKPLVTKPETSVASFNYFTFPLKPLVQIQSTREAYNVETFPPRTSTRESRNQLSVVG